MGEFYTYGWLLGNPADAGRFVPEGVSGKARGPVLLRSKFFVGSRRPILLLGDLLWVVHEVETLVNLVLARVRLVHVRRR